MMIKHCGDGRVEEWSGGEVEEECKGKGDGRSKKDREREDNEDRVVRMGRMKKEKEANSAVEHGGLR